MTCLDKDLELLDHGFFVMPIRPNDKRPIPGFQWRELKERFLIPLELEEMFEKVPEANLALITGSIYGVWALDMDGLLCVDYIREHCPQDPQTPGDARRRLSRLLPAALRVPNYKQPLPEEIQV